MRAAVTGGAGFIGHHLVRRLLADGAEVVVIDDFSSGDPARLAGLNGRLSICEGSVLEPGTLDSALAGCDVVFHEAAIASVARSIEEPRRVDEVNVGGTIEVVQAAGRQRVGRVVLAGSSAVYGTTAELPCRETRLGTPASPYGASKLAAEGYLHALGRLCGVDTVVLRYFNVYGPGQSADSEYAAVVPKFISTVLAGGRPVFNGSADLSRDFIHVDDVVRANLTAAAPSAPSGLTCNIASGTATSLGLLLATICDVVGRRVEPIIGPPRTGDIPHSVADVSLARDVLGFSAAVTLRDGLASSVAWWRSLGNP
jgi:UDP-glucose 4-epimerase